MMLTTLAYLFLAASLALAYWFMIRPLLRARPALADFYRASDSWWSALWLKLDSIKTKLLAALFIIANAMIGMHDFLIPIVTGIDWTPITEKVPAWVWPLVGMAVGALFAWLRRITAQATEQKLVAVETGVVTAAQAIDADDAETEVAVKAVVVPTPKE